MAMKWVAGFGVSVLAASVAWSGDVVHGAAGPEGRSDRERAQVVLVARDARGETWRARTVVRGCGAPSTIDEQLVLGPDGRLLRGFVQVAAAQGAVSRRWYEPATATIIVEEDGAVVRRPTANDVPWIYETLGPCGVPVVTPLGAWATYRATAGAPVVRVVSTASSRRVPSDQILVATERGPLVVSGEAAAEVDARFGVIATAASDVTSLTPADPKDPSDAL